MEAQRIINHTTKKAESSNSSPGLNRHVEDFVQFQANSQLVIAHYSVKIRVIASKISVEEISFLIIFIIIGCLLFHWYSMRVLEDAWR